MTNQFYYYIEFGLNFSVFSFYVELHHFLHCPVAVLYVAIAINTQTTIFCDDIQLICESQIKNIYAKNQRGNTHKKNAIKHTTEQQQINDICAQCVHTAQRILCPICFGVFFSVFMISILKCVTLCVLVV